MLTNYISIHALREESDPLLSYTAPYTLCISIHALREESDLSGSRTGQTRRISIHALREESDSFATKAKTTVSHFYPRSP